MVCASCLPAVGDRMRTQICGITVRLPQKHDPDVPDRSMGHASISSIFNLLPTERAALSSVSSETARFCGSSTLST